MVRMPSESQGKNWKLARPFYGPYRVLQVTPTNVEVRLVDQPKGDSIFVALERVRRCYTEQGDTTWTGHNIVRSLVPRGLPSQLVVKPRDHSKDQPATHSKSRLQSKK